MTHTNRRFLRILFFRKIYILLQKLKYWTHATHKTSLKNYRLFFGAGYLIIYDWMFIRSSKMHSILSVHSPYSLLLNFKKSDGLPVGEKHRGIRIMYVSKSRTIKTKLKQKMVFFVLTSNPYHPELIDLWWWLLALLPAALVTQKKLPLVLKLQSHTSYTQYWFRLSSGLLIRCCWPCCGCAIVE